MEKKTAIYYGMFKLFTLAHADIVEQALKMFDKIIILVMPEVDTVSSSSLYRISAKIHGHFRTDPRIEVIIMQADTESIGDIAREHNAEFAIFDTITEQTEAVKRLNNSIARRCSMIPVYLYPFPEHQDLSPAEVIARHYYAEDMSKYVIAGKLPKNPKYSDEFKDCP